MGLTFLKVKVANPADPDITETVQFLVDSGAMYSVVPTEIFDQLGIKRIAEQEFRL